MAASVSVLGVYRRGLDDNLVQHAQGAFDLSAFRQSDEPACKVLWLEPNGEYAIADPECCFGLRSPAWKKYVRLAIFADRLDLEKPFNTPFGPVQLTDPIALPLRLGSLEPAYEAMLKRAEELRAMMLDEQQESGKPESYEALMKRFDEFSRIMLHEQQE
jgi:hypothetical protein